MASMTRKTRTRVARREGVMESLCSEIYGASSLATRCGLVPPYLGLWKYQYSWALVSISYKIGSGRERFWVQVSRLIYILGIMVYNA